jgi:inhibitor of the pro-sigma K processing machinery
MLSVTDNKIYILFMVAAVVLIVAAMKLKAEWLMNFVMRSILGTVAIYFINGALENLGVTSSVGVNPLTVLTSGILGFPGLAALYGIGFCNFL